jgi:ribose transport system ATP-binding protein
LDLVFESNQVLGIAGLAGSGHSEIGSILFGQAPFFSGTIVFEGVVYRPESASVAIKRGIAYLPADRNGEAAAPELSLRENLFMNPLSKLFTLIWNKMEMTKAVSILQKFDVRPPESEKIFSTLSGGNAQKVVLSRWMDQNPRIIILNDPTAAVDVGSRREIHKRLREAAESGVSVVIITSDLEEVEQVCDRAVVIRAGQVAADLRGARVTVAEMTRYAYEAA